MTAIDNTPGNINFLSQLNFKFLIKKAPHVNFFIQKVNIAAITNKSVQTGNPFVNIPQPGEHLTFSPLKITFKVDEDLKNYLEIHQWLIGLGKPQDFDQYYQLEQKPQWTGEGLLSDISVLILTNSNTPNYEVTYVDAFPYALSDLVFTTTDSDINYMTATAEFNYTYYTISRNVH